MIKVDDCCCGCPSTSTTKFLSSAIISFRGIARAFLVDFLPVGVSLPLLVSCCCSLFFCRNFVIQYDSVAVLSGEFLHIAGEREHRV